MSAIKVTPLQADELEDFIRLYWAAFDPIEADMIAPMIYTGGLDGTVMEHSKARFTREYGDKLGDFCFCARDATTNELLAVARWTIVDDPPKTMGEIESQYQTVRKNWFSATSVPSMNLELGDAFLKASAFCEGEIMLGQPHITLKLLATHPKHHRKGAGSALLKPWLEKADRLCLPVYLDAATNGKALYEKHGFVVHRDFPIDARQFGGRSPGRHWCMARPPNHQDQKWDKPHTVEHQ